MDARREERLERLFEEASALTPGSRERFARDSCADDPELRDVLVGLLARAGAANAYVAGVAAPAVDRELTSLFDTDARDDPLVGAAVAHFRVIAPLGRGGMGRVYQARDESLGRVVALKLLPAGVWADEASRRRFEREARAASAIDHPNVCAVHEFGRTDAGQPFIAMALCPGESLRDVIARGPLSTATALGYAVQMVEALRHAHAAGVVHRDVKPANVMIAADGRVRIVDFGIALIRGDVTREGASMGTIAYMSPEQTHGADVDERTDVWSVGAVLHEMLTGRKAFGRDSDEATIHAIRHDRPGGADGRGAIVPWQAAAIVARCLEKEPARRYRRADELLADLSALQLGQVPAAARRARRSRVVPGALAAAFLLGALHTPTQTREAAPHRVDPAAMALYVQGVRAHSRSEMMRTLEQAVAVDPRFALAHAELGLHYTPMREGDKARRAIAAALALDSTLPKAWIARGAERQWLAHDWDEAERAFRRAIALDQESFYAHHELAQLLMRRGRCDDAVAEERQAILYQPTSGFAQSGLGEILHFCHRYEEALREFERWLPISDDTGHTYFRISETYFAMGRYADALAAQGHVGEPVPPWLNAALGRTHEARDTVARLEAKWERGDGELFTGWDIARTYAVLGDREAALSWLERLTVTNSGPVVYLGVEPAFDPLRGEPRFQELLRRVRLR